MYDSTVFAVAGEFPIYFVAVYVVGLVAAVSIGLIAWYNSKRPVGWERTQRPKFIPKVKTGVDQEPLTFEKFEQPDIDPSEAPTQLEGPGDGGEHHDNNQQNKPM
ncbi:MAG: hypothetical protein VKL20_01215 [Synechocystis sp.]|nr:hypothetical protein [Synechocystis sp.]